MKKSLLFLSLIFSFCVFSSFQNNQIQTVEKPIANISAFCDGWADGHCEGYRDVKGRLAVCPPTPVCPVPNVGEQRYRDGYNRGFKAGRAYAQN